MAKQKIYLGTELKLSVKIEPINNTSMDDYDFEVKVINSVKKSFVEFTKKGRPTDTDGIKLSENFNRDENGNYVVAFDTTELGVGGIVVKVSAHIPDGDFKDRTRTEIVEIDTGIEVVKGIL